MPILIAVRALNSAFSYCPCESEESFAFFWDSLKAHYFEKGTDKELAAPSPPKVILRDQAGRLIASIPKAFPQAQI